MMKNKSNIKKKINNMKKKAKKTYKKYDWVVLFILSILFAMWIYGMADHYFPEPLHAGLGQYFDVAIGITIIGTILFVILLTIVFKKKRKKEISDNEYLRIRT